MFKNFLISILLFLFISACSLHADKLCIENFDTKLKSTNGGPYVKKIYCDID